jgi:hypothetical protein
MSAPLEAPGAALVVLRRQATTTDVLLIPAGDGLAGLPSADARADLSQWGLAEDLARESAAPLLDRLYASPFSLRRDGRPLGVFVGFVDREGVGEPEEDGGHWMDLREACSELEAGWGGVLQSVRERFVARPPDEALRIR